MVITYEEIRRTFRQHAKYKGMQTVVDRTGASREMVRKVLSGHWPNTPKALEIVIAAKAVYDEIRADQERIKAQIESALSSSLS